MTEGRRALLWHASWVLISVGSSLLAYRLSWVPHESGTIADLTSGFAPFVQAFADEGVLLPSTIRLPVVTLIHGTLSLVLGPSLLPQLLLRNLLSYGLIAYAVRRLCTQRASWVPFALLVSLTLNPFALRTLPLLGGEESYFVPLLLTVFALLVSPGGPRTAHLVGAMLAGLCMTKSTLTLIAIAVLLTLAVRREIRALRIAGLYVCTTLAAWSAWSHETTDRWTHVVNISAYDGYNLYKGNNEYVKRLHYPDVHLDTLDYAGVTQPPEEVRDDEWALDDWYRSQAVEFLSADLTRAARLFALKAGAAFLFINTPGRIELREPESPELLELAVEAAEQTTLKSRLTSYALWLFKVLWLASLVVAARRAAQADFASQLYVALSAALALPLVVGFAYVHHLAVLYELMLMYAFVRPQAGVPLDRAQSAR